MYRTPTHEPRYKQRTRDRVSRCKARRYEEQRVSSEASSSEEDEESTDRYTEESEDTTESQQDQGDCEWNAAGSSFDRGNVFNNRGTRPEDFLMRAYYAREGVQKHDKITQKNFLSPFPSFLIPPIYRGGAPLQNYRYPTAGNPGENEDAINSGKPPRGSPKKSGNHEEENICACFTTHDQKLCDKHKAQREMKYLTKNMRAERVFTCTQGKTPLDSSPMLSRSALAEEPSSRNSPKMECGRKPKGGFRESRPEELSPKCKDCLQSMENRKRGRRSTAVMDMRTEKAAKEPHSGATSPCEALGSAGSGKVREKLVYVVEEEGKDLTKLETDLFSVNEILTIKKHLLELSEFAKKLKTLKEMKRDLEKGKPGKSGCQCKPVAELLKNVNKRIEALEARQEELERGSHKTSQKGDIETESKKTADQKTLSDSPPKTPVVRKQSAMMSVPKPEMVISRAGLSNNSEIVNELMDIKTQLLKLEKRRMSRELTPEAKPLGESNIAKKKDHAIAVFSSRTYILTSENYEKTKTQQSVKAEEPVKSYFPISDDPRSRTEQTKENVANWLKSVSPIRELSENEVAVFLEAEKPEPEINAAQRGSIGCTNFFNGIESQEPPKNRASEAKSEKPPRTNLDFLTKNVSKTRLSNRQTSHVICKECIMTSDGKLFVKKSGNDFANGRISSSKGAKEVGVRRSASSCSASSLVLTKERVGRMKKFFRDIPALLATHSKSTQELSSSDHKDQKTARNPKVKNPATPRREKSHRENKNELVKKRETEVDVLKDFGRGDDPQSSSTFSELIRTINLEKPSDSLDEQNSYRNNMHIYSLATMARLNLKGFDMKYKEDTKERAKEKRRREEEAEREAPRKEIQKPGYSRHNEPGTTKVVNLCEKEKVEKVEQEVCECVCCCKKKTKVCSDKKIHSGNETCSTVDSVVEPKIHRSSSRERRRRRKKCSSERVVPKKCKDRDKKKKEKKKHKLCKMISKEIAKRKRSKEAKVCKRRSSKTVCPKKSKSRERPKKKKCEESPKIMPSRRGIFCRHYLPSCNCQAPPETSSCENDPTYRRPYCREGNRSSESLKPPESICPQPPSKDSVEIYLKRQRRKAQIEKEKLADDSCPFRNVFKNLRKFYPKFSNFQLGNYSGEFSDVKAAQQQQQPQKCSYSDINPTGYSERSLCQCRSRELKDRGHNHHHFQHHNTPNPGQYCNDSYPRHATKPEHLKNCKCVRVYLQTQGCQEWPGVMPHPKLSDKSETEISSANLTESKKPIKRDFIFPGRLPESQYVGHCCEKKPKCKKHSHKNHKKKSNHCKCHRKKHHKKKNLCVCDKCGNVHRRKTHKVCVVKCDHEEKKDLCNCHHKATEVKHHRPPVHHPQHQLHLPMFSFLRYFCKSKPHPSSAHHKTSRACHKKVHKEKKHPKEHHHKTHPQKAGSCCSKLCKIEERLEHLEKVQHHKEVEGRTGKKEHMKKHCDCTETSDPDSQGPSDCKPKKTHKTKCCCCPASQNEIHAYYFTNPISSKAAEPSETVETNESLTTKTTTTTTTTPTTTEDTETSTPSKSPDDPSSKGHCKLRGRLSSLQSLLNSFHRCRKSKPHTNNSANIFFVKETGLVDDCSPMQRGRIVPELKADSSSFLRKIKKLKGRRSKKQSGDKEEKVIEVEEKLHHKSRGRRHE